MAMEDLVSSIKELQRTDAVAKEQWWTYCDAEGGGIRDPAKHQEDFVRTFIENYAAGQRFEANVAATGNSRIGPGFGGLPGAGNGVVAVSGGGGRTLAQLCKEGQRKSQNWKQTWAQYCQVHGGGINDPQKHSEAFVVGFLDHVAARGVRVLSEGTTGTTARWPPAKRPRTAPTALGQSLGMGMSMGMGMGMGSAWGAKEELVQRIKTFQRSGEAAKAQWWSYCDTHLGGIRDPARHDIPTLTHFAQSFGV